MNGFGKWRLGAGKCWRRHGDGADYRTGASVLGWVGLPVWAATTPLPGTRIAAVQATPPHASMANTGVSAQPHEPQPTRGHVHTGHRHRPMDRELRWSEYSGSLCIQVPDSFAAK